MSFALLPRDNAPEVPEFALRVTDLRKVFRRRAGELRCSFDLPAGSITALIGANGAGKTTLLHLITGLAVPTSGRVTVGGHPVTPGRPSPAIGFVAQGAPLYPTMKVSEIASVARRLNPAWKNGPLDSVLDRAEISRSAKVGTLSTGERAQLALGLALAKRPDLLVLDEPFANLDPVAARSVMAVISTEVAEAGTTVLLSTHAIADVHRLCDRVVLMKRGEVVLNEDVDDLLGRHRRVVVPSDRVDLLLRARPQIVHRNDGPRESSFIVEDFEPGDIRISGLRDDPVDLVELVLARLH